MKFIKGGKCMKKGYLKRSFAFCLILAMMLMLGIVSFADDAAPAMTPGTYTGTAKSVGGPLSVEVEVTEDAIVSITVTECNDSEGVGTTAAELLPDRIVEAQSTNIDGVSGATLSSIFLRNAVRAALTEAGADSKQFNDKVAFPAKAQTDMEADVVVVGGGLAGLSAAATAAINGLNVILLEKNGFLGGNSIISDQAITGPIGDPFSVNVERLEEQMIGYDLKIEHIDVDYPGYGQMKVISLPEKGDVLNCIYLRDIFADLIIKNGGLILTETPGIGLLSENGTVTGVTAQPRGQEPFNITAKAVILTTGGFSSNPELVAKYLPYAEGAFNVGLGGNKGDALSWVEDLDAKLVEMEAEKSAFYSVSPSSGYYAEKSGNPNHFVDKTGKLITDNPDYNQGTMAVYQAIGREQYYAVTSLAEVQAAGVEAEFDHPVLAGSIQRFESIEEMAAALEMPEIAQTLADLGLEDGVYFAGLATAGIYGTYGGIATDDEARVLNNNDEVIPGLYAAGEVLGSRNFQNVGFYAGGVGPALIIGNTAGNTVAADLAE